MSEERDLPIVNEQVAEVIIRDLERRFKEGTLAEYVDEMKENIEKRNPYFYELPIKLTEVFAKSGRIKTYDELEKTNAIICMGCYLAYELLSRQLEIDTLENQGEQK